MAIEVDLLKPCSIRCQLYKEYVRASVRVCLSRTAVECRRQRRAGGVYSYCSGGDPRHLVLPLVCLSGRLLSGGDAEIRVSGGELQGSGRARDREREKRPRERQSAEWRRQAGELKDEG